MTPLSSLDYLLTIYNLIRSTKWYNQYGFFYNNITSYISSSWKLHFDIEKIIFLEPIINVYGWKVGIDRTWYFWGALLSIRPTKSAQLLWKIHFFLYLNYTMVLDIFPLRNNQWINIQRIVCILPAVSFWWLKVRWWWNMVLLRRIMEYQCGWSCTSDLKNPYISPCEIYYITRCLYLSLQ